MPPGELKVGGALPPRRRRASWHAVANAVVLAWLALTVVAAVARDHLPAPHWLLIHVFLLGAVTNAIVTWTEHFATALLRLPAPARWWPVTRLAALNAGVAAVLHGAADGRTVLAVAGAAAVVAVVGAHAAVLIVRSRRAFGGRFRHVVAWYVSSALALVAGGTLGGLMASGRVPAAWHPRLETAHVHANLFGWVGLAVLGTLFTLWPTVLRTQIADGTTAIARRSLLLAGPGLAAAVAGLAAGTRWIATAGLLLYAAGAALSLAPFVRAFRRRRPHTPAAWMLAAATGWLVVAVAADLAVVATRPPGEVADGTAPLIPLILVAFVGQTLIGSLTFLLPMVLGGGPAAVKRNNALLDRAWTVRFGAVNLAAPLLALPVPGWATRAAWTLLLAALAAFVVLAAVAIARSFGMRPSSPVAGAAIGGLLTALALVLAISGPGTPDEGSAGPAAGGGTRTVEVTLADMRVRPATIEVPAGTRLVLRVTNRDAQRHDLRLETGQRTPMLRTGESAALTVPSVAGNVDGWCTVVGHRAAGMTMQIRAADAPAASHSTHAPPRAASGTLDLTAPMGPRWRPYDAALRPAPGGKEHRVELRAAETDVDVAPGVRQRMWTFGGTVPGPVLRGRVGDVFTVTFVNDGSMGHGIDFHAGSLAPDEPMRTIQPGERLTYRFRADHAGAWLYHCSTMPMSQHIANGMYGAVIVDPPGLKRPDREYLLVQGELFLGDPDGERAAKIRDGRPDGWMFNGTAAGHDHAPLTAKAGERVRIWVVAAGPSSGTAFHVVGARFDTVYKEGGYLLRRGDPGGAQVLDLAPAQGGFVETVFPDPGHYPFVDHTMRHAESGARGVVKVSR